MVKESQPIYRITDMQETDRPRERLAELGAQALTNAELLAILLRVGVQGENAVQVGQRLLQDLGGLHGLHRASFSEVCAQHGVGEAKAAQIKAAIELGRRLAMQAPEERAAIHSPADAAEMVRYEMGALEQEHLRVILLDTRNRVISSRKNVYRIVEFLDREGGRIIQGPRFERSAASIIVVHNHPSGAPRSM